MLIDQGYLNCFALTGPVDVLDRCIEETTLPYYVSSISVNHPVDTSRSPGFQETVRLLCREAIQPRAPIGIARLPNISRPILGPLRVLKGPVRQFGNGEKHSTVWFWLHPTMSSDAWKIISSLSYVCTDQEETSEATHIKLADCTGHLCRIKLIGPFSHQILADILQPHSEMPGSGDWSLWKALLDYQKSSLFPSGCALTLLCLPFLANRPRVKLFNRNWLIPEPKMGKDPANLGGIFVSKALSQFDFSKIQLDKRDLNFSDRIVQWFSSAQPCCFSNTGIPIILIQNATPSLSSQKSQCVGWDIVLPRQLLKPLTDDNKNATPAVNTSAPRDFVVACVYRGVRVGGLRDQLRWACLTTEAAARVDAFPYALWPETPAAKLITDEKLHIRVERNENGKLTGDAKRRARIKFRCSPPTTKDWLELMESFHPSVPTSQGDSDGTAENSFFFVLRDKAMLVLVVRRLLAGDPRARHLTVDHLSRYDPHLSRALIMVKLEVVSRGIPESKAEIYAPLEAGSPSLGPPSAETPRKLIGYVDEGGYAFSHGLCIAIGFISLAAVCSLSPTERLPNGLQTVLFKSSKSGIICAAKMTVVI